MQQQKRQTMKEINTELLIAERFKEVITKLNLTRSGIAKELDIRPQTVGDYCSGKTLPSAKVLGLLNSEYDININWMLSGTGEMFENPSSGDFNPDYVYFGDTLRDLLNDDELHTTHSNFALVGGISEEELEAILSNKMQPPATALRKWAINYRLNLNFLLAQIGYPLLTLTQYEQRGPLMWVRERDGENQYPRGASEPSYSKKVDSIDYGMAESLPPVTEQTIKTIPLVGLAECGINGWSTQMQMAATALAPDIHEGIIAALAIGGSMTPAGILPGNIVYCDPKMKPRAGEPVYVVRRDGQGNSTATVKLFQKEEDGWIYLYGWLPMKNGEKHQKDFSIKESMEFIEIIAPVVLIRKRSE